MLASRAWLFGWLVACASASAQAPQAPTPAPSPAPSAPTLPSLGDSDTQHMSLNEERRLGLSIMREIRQHPAYLDDPLLQDYVGGIWRSLVRAAQARGDLDEALLRQLPLEVFLVRDRNVNAMALPGGFVGVYLPLITLTTNRDQLASVLAHELTHVSQRHIARGVAAQERSSLIGLATVLLGVVAATRGGNADVANAAIAGGQGLAMQGQINFTRAMEHEADRIGLAVLQRAGFSPMGQVQMFERLGAHTGVFDDGSFPYLRSHPLSVERVAEANNRVMLATTRAPAATVEHTLMQARARLLADTSQAALQRHITVPTPAQAQHALPALYAATLAHLLLANPAAADASARQLLAHADQAGVLPANDAPARRVLQLLHADVLVANGQAAHALQVLQAICATPLQPAVVTPVVAPDAAPFSAPFPAPETDVRRSRLLARAQAMVSKPAASTEPHTTSAREVLEELQVWLTDHPQDASAWGASARLAQALNQTVRSLRAQAEARAALGDVVGAIDRLRAAQRSSAQAEDHIERSIVESRLRQLQAQRRQEVLEAREAARGRDRDRDRDRDPERPQVHANSATRPSALTPPSRTR